MRLWILLSTLTLVSLPAVGQVAEFSVHGGKSLIPDGEIGSGYSLGDGFRFGFRTTLNNWMFFGHEFGYAYNRTKLLINDQPLTDNQGNEMSGMAIHQGFYNFLAYATPEGSRVRPFGTGGVHFSNFVPPGASVSQGGGQTKYGFNYGGGIKFRILERYGVRLDFRQYVTGKPFDLGSSGKLKQNEISVGFGLFL
jgi:opacity protein-like surface antigen